MHVSLQCYTQSLDFVVLTTAHFTAPSRQQQECFACSASNGCESPARHVNFARQVEHSHDEHLKNDFLFLAFNPFKQTSSVLSQFVHFLQIFHPPSKQHHQLAINHHGGQLFSIHSEQGRLRLQRQRNQDHHRHHAELDLRDPGEQRRASQIVDTNPSKANTSTTPSSMPRRSPPLSATKTPAACAPAGTPSSAPKSPAPLLDRPAA